MLAGMKVAWNFALTRITISITNIVYQAASYDDIYKYELHDLPNNDSEDDFHTACGNVSHNQQQSFSGLRKLWRSPNYKHWLSWVITNNSPSQDYTNPEDQPTTNIDSPGSQPTTVLLRTIPTRTINQLQTLTHLDHNQQQSFLGLHQPGRSTNHKHWLAWITTNNSPSKDYTNPDDHPTTNTDSSWVTTNNSPS